MKDISLPYRKNEPTSSSDTSANETPMMAPATRTKQVRIIDPISSSPGCQLEARDLLADLIKELGAMVFFNMALVPQA